MSVRRFLLIGLVVGLSIILTVSVSHTVAAWSGLRVPTFGPMTPDDPVSIASLVYYWYYDGEQGGGEEAGLGYSVSTAGDVNGDGYDDIIVGAPVYSHTVNAEGVAFVFYGPLGSGASPNWTFGSGQKGARLGASVGPAGDVNGDGCDDIIIGAPLYDVSEQSMGRDAGRAYVFYGCSEAENRLSTTPNWILDGEGRDDYFGFSVGTAGDVNDDGYDDVVVGAPQYDDGEADEGRVYVFIGFGDGQTTTLFWSAEGDQSNTLFGAAVGTAGDVNGDGYDDVIVGAPAYDNGEQDEGATFVFYGSSAVISASLMIDINRAEAEFGASVGTAGDVNGDGYDDIIVGAPVYSDTVKQVGAAFAFYGSPSGLSITPTWMFKGGQANARFGASVGTAGDVNGDGYDDVIIGAYLYSTSSTSPTKEGLAFGFNGSDTGLSSTVYWSASGGKAGTEFGYSVGTAGDVNGDGYADVIIGAPRYRRSRILYGRAFVYRGVGDPPEFHIYLPLVLRTILF